MESYAEDDLTAALIQLHEQPADITDIESVTITPEAHYNYYGSRGVADLYVSTTINKNSGLKKQKDRLYEVKAELTNANEVIRQFNRMVKYFYKGGSWPRPDAVRYELTILPTHENYSHLRSYFDIYQSLNGKVFFRHPENPTPVSICPQPDMALGSDRWFRMAKNMNETIWNELRGEGQVGRSDD